MYWTLDTHAYITSLLWAIYLRTTTYSDAKLITTLYYCICQAHWFDIVPSQAPHLSLLEGKLIIVLTQTPDFTTTNVKYWYQKYKAYVRLVWQPHPIFTPIVICTHNLTTLRQCMNNFVVSFTTMLLVLFYWLLSLILLHILLFLCHVFLFCKHFWESQTCALPLNIHMLKWFRMAWRWLCKLKLVASIHIDNKLMCFD
jgi:hypothetical protein